MAKFKLAEVISQVPLGVDDVFDAHGDAHTLVPTCAPFMPD